MDGFIRTLNNSFVEHAINSDTLVIDIETTALTALEPATKITKQSKIGKWTLSQYKKLFDGDVHFDTTPRARILAIHIPDHASGAVDLDALSEQDKSYLIHNIIDNKRLIGHNLSFDLSFLKWYAQDAEPACILDTMLLMRIAQPGLSETGLNTLAACGSEAAHSLVKSSKGNTSLAACAIIFCLDEQGETAESKAFQKPKTWTPNELTAEHYSYAVSDVDLPLTLAKKILRLDDRENIDNVFDAAFNVTSYKMMSDAAIVLSKMHHRGVPIDLSKIEERKKELIDQVITSANEIIEIDDRMYCHLDELESLNGSVKADLKNTVLSILKSRGFDVKDSIKEKELRLLGCSGDEFFETWIKLQKAKKIIGYIENWRVRQRDGRIHPLISIGCSTMRTSSNNPNIQNIPSKHRDLFSLSDDDNNTLAAIDFSQIELRIASQLALRAHKEVKSGTSDNLLPRYIKEALDDYREFGAVPDRPDVEPTDISDEQDRIKAYMQKNMREYIESLDELERYGHQMLSAFKSGADPHTLTAIQISADVDTGEMSTVEFLASLTKEDYSKLKSEISDARQSAKALNFGLLYGMSSETLWKAGVTDYGLSWSLEEASKMREAWFKAYPELRFWQIHTHLTRKKKQIELIEKGRGGSTYKTSRTAYIVETCSGRKIGATTKNSVLNFGDQGTGADILLDVISRDLQPRGGRILAAIHDELLVEVPKDRAHESVAEFERIMCDVASEHLTDVPVDVESGVGTWDH